jgi:hypothetical protein
VARRFGGDICIWAGMDVQHTIPYSTPEDVRREVRFMFDTYYRKDDRFILAAGNNMTPDAPLESIHALLDEALYYGIKKSKTALRQGCFIRPGEASSLHPLADGYVYLDLAHGAQFHGNNQGFHFQVI